jgi:pimeloyl-ACP methyl ester carboxylesterase/DNA-binding CsgD family transcriptional regulator
MKDRTPPLESPATLGRDHRAEIVDRLYEVALDPVRLEDLLDVWEGRVGPTRSEFVAAAVEMDDEEIETHMRRATVFLDRFEATRSDHVYRSVLEDIPRSAAFLADGGAAIAAFNRPAAIAFGLKEGAELTDLPFDPEDVAVLRGVIHGAATGRAERVVMLRLRSRVTDSPVIVRVGSIESDNTRPLALIMSTELVWPEGFELMVQEAFGLTAAEVEIVRGITLGLPVKDIAEARGRSPETVRTQVRSILAKSETHSQSELVRVVLGLMDVAQMPTENAGPVPRVGTLDQLSFQQLRCPDGRRLEWIEFGQPTGAPCLFTHLDYGFIRWPATAERAARARGIRVIVPVRAGYGRSDPHARGADHLQGVTQDYLAVLDHLGVRRCAVLTMGADLRFALNISLLREGLVTAILGCAAQLPLRTSAQYDRMDKWQRFILANARYAPKILPFLVQAGFSLARKLGKEKFFAKVNGGSAADLEAFGRAEVREALLAGSEISLGAKVLAHEAFTRECIGSEKDWSHLVRGVTVPVQMLQGDQDPQTPVQTIEELRGDYPHLDISFLPNTGQLLFFAEWPLVLDVLEKYLPRR